MPILHVCAHDGCETLTLGGLCITHEPPVETRVFPRGRPFPPLEPRGPSELPRFLGRDSLYEEQTELVRGFA
jgi:hypothetical protein